MKPLVSILIPAHDLEKWIADTIRSGVAQTWEQKEISIVDDGSTDQTLAIAQQFASESVLFVKQDNRGARQSEAKLFRSAREITFNGWMRRFAGFRQDYPADVRARYGRTLLSSSWGHFIYRPYRAGSFHMLCGVNSLRQSFCGASWNKGCVHASSGAVGQLRTD
jgi:hypothetical protein